MGWAHDVLDFFHWVPPREYHNERLHVIVCHSYGLWDEHTLTPLTETVTKKAGALFRRNIAYKGGPLIVLATTHSEGVEGERIAMIEGTIRKKLLGTHGVPEDKIRVLYHTRSTQTEIAETIRVILDEFGYSSRCTIALCVNDLHARRSLGAYRKAISATFGWHVSIYASPVYCGVYTPSIIQVRWRSFTIRYEWAWAAYMVATWAAWKLRLIK